MSRMVGVPCACGCGATLKRKPYRGRVPLVLCTAASNRAQAVMRSLQPLDEFNAEHRLSNRFWSDREAIQAALNGDVTTCQQRVDLVA